MKGMTQAERRELGSLIRKRERVMKTQAQERSATLLAEFDAQSAKIYQFDDDPIWKQAHEEAEKAILKAQEEIAARCAELGIPRDFAPNIGIYWIGRGHNAVLERRTELRRAAKSRIAAIEAEAVAQIERLSLQAQTEIVASGLQSEAANAFLQALPNMEQLMPPVEFGEIEQLVETKRQQRRIAYDA